MAKLPKALNQAVKVYENDQFEELRLILGDQLNAEHSWYRQKNNKVLYVVAELYEEVTYVKHHLQKVAAFFFAIENFAKALVKAKHHVLHLTLDQTQGINSAKELLRLLAGYFSISRIS